MPHLPDPSEDSFTPAMRDALAGRPRIALYKAVSWSPSLMPHFMRMVTAFFQDTSLDALTREAAILRVAMHHDSAYEIHHHRGLALQAGLTPTQVQALLTPGTPDVNALVDTGPDAGLRDIVKFVDEAVTNTGVSESTFRAIERRHGPRGATELALLAGFYRMVATFIGGMALQPDALTAVELRRQLT